MPTTAATTRARTTAAQAAMGATTIAVRAVATIRAMMGATITAVPAATTTKAVQAGAGTTAATGTTTIDALAP
jgi:hypothetical protein